MKTSDEWRAISRCQAQEADAAEARGDDKQAAMFRAESRENWHNAGQLDHENNKTR